MEKIYVKGLGLIPNNTENKELLTSLGHIKDDTINEKPVKPVRANVKRVKQPRRA